MMMMRLQRTTILWWSWTAVTISIGLLALSSATQNSADKSWKGGLVGEKPSMEGTAIPSEETVDRSESGLAPDDGIVKNVLLHEAVRKILRLPSSSGSEPHKKRQLLPDPHKPLPMPRYVLDLYEKYRSGDMRNGPDLGNTVRSIHAEIGEVNGEAMFVFNLSSVAPTEQVLRAHIHLYKQKSVDRKKRSRMRRSTELLLYEVAPNYLSQIGTISMRPSSKGWQWYVATDAVKSCLLAHREHPHLFAVSFRAEKPDGKVRKLALKRFVWRHSLPFLILYSNETESVNLEELDIVAERMKPPGPNKLNDKVLIPENDHLQISNPGTDSEDKENDEDGDDKEENEVTNVRDSHNEEQYFFFGRTFGTGDKDGSKTHHKSKNKSAKRNDKTTVSSHNEHSTTPWPTRSTTAVSGRDTLMGSPLSQRKKRSILTNEIPEDPAEYLKMHYRLNVPQTHPGMLTARNEIRHKLEDSRLIPYPAHRGSGERRRRKHRKRKSRRQHQENRDRNFLPEQWEEYHENIATPYNNPGQLCSRRRLVVDFADIGWGDWIISPKSFEAHYCAGTCPFPLTKKLRPSNHATIQSIVNAIGVYADVPAPCCIPDVMTSVTLLYFDENRNVVLKNYPGMSVQSCACR